MYPSPGILEVLCGLLVLTKNQLWITCYCFDSSEGTAVLGTLMRKGVQILMLMDEHNMRTPSCRRQFDRMLDLMRGATGNGGSITVKQLRPAKHHRGFSSMHVKSWLADAQVYIGGSYNFTYNAEVANAEHLVVATEYNVITVHKDWFLGLWDRATLVTVEMVEYHRDKELARTSRSATRSEPRDRRGGSDHD